MRRSSLVLVLAATLAGCQPAASGSEDLLPAELPAGAALTGPVLERLTAAPYMYLRVKAEQGEVWAAVPEAELAVGTVVTVANPMLMSNFESTALQRTFEAVYFGTLSSGEAGVAVPPGHPDISGTPSADPGVVVGQVDKASGADARTVAETWAERDALAGRRVVVRGVVVKYLVGILGKNWVHLRDGSGDAAAGTNDLTVTTLEEVKVGDTITITGTVRTEADFGLGYRYPVLVEDARVARQ